MEPDYKEIIEKYNNNWNKISTHKFLSEDFIRKFADKLNWKNISFHQKLSGSLLKEFKDKIIWEYVSLRQK